MPGPVLLTVLNTAVPAFRHVLTVRLCLQLGILWVCASLALWRSVMGVVICVKPSLKYLYRYVRMQQNQRCAGVGAVLTRCVRFVGDSTHGREVAVCNYVEAIPLQRDRMSVDVPEPMSVGLTSADGCSAATTITTTRCSSCRSCSSRPSCRHRRCWRGYRSCIRRRQSPAMWRRAIVPHHVLNAQHVS